MPRSLPPSPRTLGEHIPTDGRLAALIATARRLAAIDRMLPVVLGPGDAAGLRAIRISPTTLTLGTDAPGRIYRLRYARAMLLTAVRALPGLEGIERLELRTLASAQAIAPDSRPAVRPTDGASDGVGQGAARALGAQIERIHRPARPPLAADLHAAAGDCTDARLAGVLKRLASHARDGGHGSG